MTRVALGERDAAHAGRIAPLEHPHLGDREADALAVARGQQDVVAARCTVCDADDPVALVELHRDLAVAVAR